MKTHVFFAVALVANAVVSYAQTSGSKMLVYDFNKSGFKSNAAYSPRMKPHIMPVQMGDFFILKIENINTFKWNVVLKGSSVDYITPIPSELQQIFRLQNENYQNKELTNALSLANNGSQNMNKQAVLAQNLPMQTDEAKKLGEVMDKLVEVCNEYLEIVQEIAEIKFKRAELINISKQDWPTHRELLNNLPSQVPPEQMKESYKEFWEYYANAIKEYNAAKKAVQSVIDRGDGNQQKAESMKEQIQSAENDIKESYNIFAKDDYLTLIEDIITLQTALENPKNFEVSSAPIQADGDYIEFFAELNPVKVNSLLPIGFSKNFPVSVPVKGGLKVDFGVGPFGSFGSGSRDEIYYTESIEGEDSVLLKQNSNKNVISPGISAMMYFGARTGKTSRLACAFGVGAGFQSVEDVNFSLFLGPGLVMGKRERVMLSAGLSYLRVDRINSEQYALDGKYPSSLNISDVTSKVFRPSFFVSMVYNLTNRLEIK